MVDDCVTSATAEVKEGMIVDPVSDGAALEVVAIAWLDSTRTGRVEVLDCDVMDTCATTAVGSDVGIDI